MKAFVLPLLTAMALGAGMAPSLAKPVTMHCTVQKVIGGWIADPIYFEHDAERDTVRVIDPIIVHFEKTARVAEITDESRKKLAFRWQVNTRVGSQSAKMDYRLAYFPANGRMSVKAFPHGYAGEYTATGRCRPVTGGLPTG